MINLGQIRYDSPHNFVSFVDCSRGGCCSDLIDGRTIKVLHVLYSGVYLYL